MEYFRHSPFIRILTVILTVIIQIDLLDSISSSHLESEIQQLKQTIDNANPENEEEVDFTYSICHLRSSQGRTPILHHWFQPELPYTIAATYRKFIAFRNIIHWATNEYRSLLTLFCVYRI